RRRAAPLRPAEPFRSEGCGPIPRRVVQVSRLCGQHLSERSKTLMAATHAAKLVDQYLQRLERELTDLSPDSRNEIIDEIRRHIAAERGGLADESDATGMNLLARLRSRSGLGRRDGRRGSLHDQPRGADRSRGHDHLPRHAPESPLRSPKVLARIASSLYLLASVCFVVGIAIRSSIEGSGGGSGLIDRIRASTSLFRISLTIDLISGTFFLLAGMALYLLLRHVDRLAAAAMVVLVAIEIVVIYLSDINLYNALSIATNPSYIQAFGAPASNALASLFVDAHANALVID